MGITRGGSRHEGHHGGTGAHFLPLLEAQVRRQRQEQVDARAETDQSHALSRLDLVTDGQVADNPAGDGAGNLGDGQRTVGRVQVNPVALVLLRGLAVERGPEAAGGIADLAHRGGHRGPVDVNIEDGEKDGNPARPAAGKSAVIHFGDLHHPAVGGRNDEPPTLRRDPVGIAEEVQHEEQGDSRRQGPPHAPGQSPGHEDQEADQDKWAGFRGDAHGRSAGPDSGWRGLSGWEFSRIGKFLRNGGHAILENQFSLLETAGFQLFSGPQNATATEGSEPGFQLLMLLVKLTILLIVAQRHTGAAGCVHQDLLVISASGIQS